MKRVSGIFEVSHASIYLWAKKVKEGDIDGLENRSKHKGGLKLKTERKRRIAEYLECDSSITILGVKKKIEEEFGIFVSKSTVHRAMKSVEYSYITPRQLHYKQKKEDLEKLKKIVEVIRVRKNYGFFDESRTHSKRGHGWFKKGIRTRVKIQMG